MANIGEIIDDKFDAAVQMSLTGMDTIRASVPMLGPPVEVIALDSHKGPESRCLLSRPCLGPATITVNGVEIFSFGVEIPRTIGDKRRFEELPQDAIEGNMFLVGTRQDSSINIAGDINPSWLTVEGLSYALSCMRVVEKIPLES